MAKPTFTQILIETRIDPSFPFYEHTESEISYKKSMMIDSGHVISEEISISDDLIDRTTITKFKSYEDRKIIFKDPGSMEINSRNIEYNRSHGITVLRKTYEGDDASLAISSDRIVARYSSNDPFCIAPEDTAVWKETLGAIGVKIDVVTGMHNGLQPNILDASDLHPVGDFVFDEDKNLIILDGTGYFVTRNLDSSNFADITVTEKTFFISIIPDHDSFTERRYLASKFSKDPSKGWYICYEPNGSVTLHISGDETSKTFTTPENLVIPGLLNTIGFTAHFSNIEDTVKIFVNGKEVLSSYQGNDITNNDNLLMVGSSGETKENLKGKLLGFRVYYRTLVESEFNILHRLFSIQLEN